MGLQRVRHDVLTEQHCFDQIRAPAPLQSLLILILCTITPACFFTFRSTRSYRRWGRAEMGRYRWSPGNQWCLEQQQQWGHHEKLCGDVVRSPAHQTLWFWKGLKQFLKPTLHSEIHGFLPRRLLSNYRVQTLHWEPSACWGPYRSCSRSDGWSWDHPSDDKWGKWRPPYPMMKLSKLWGHSWGVTNSDLDLGLEWEFLDSPGSLGIWRPSSLHREADQAKMQKGLTWCPGPRFPQTWAPSPASPGLGGSRDDHSDVPTPFLIPRPLSKLSHADSNYAY